MNLTSEQIALLETLTEFHQNGCKASFIVSQCMAGTSLVCMENKCPNVSIDADVSDFLQLKAENLIQLNQSERGTLSGKPTQRGIEVIRQRGARPQNEHTVRKMIVGLQRAIEATFDRGRWLQLGHLTDSEDAIRSHPRLFSSLEWGDKDYSSCVFDILPTILGPNRENLSTVEEFVGLQDWLQKNDRKLYGELYSPGLMPLEHIEDASSLLNISELSRHARRIREGIRGDPAHAIGSAKELLETVLRSVIGDHTQKPQADIPTLLKQAQQKLGLDPKSVAGTLPGTDTLFRTLSNLGQIVIGVAELRTLYGTGHGRSRGRDLEIAHARLVVNSAVTVATFLVEVWTDQNRPV